MKTYLKTLLVLAFAGMLLGARGVWAQSNLVLLVSQPGDYIGQGATSVTTNPGDFTVSTEYGYYGSASTLVVSAFGYAMYFTGPSGATLTVGDYTNAARWPFNGTAPGLDVSGQGRGCNAVCGEFHIRELHLDGGGKVDRFWVTFVHICECAMAPLTGEVRYNSQLAPPVPTARTLRVPADFPNIQAALDNASLLVVDTVLVAPGAYNQSVNFHGKRVRLTSESGPAQTFLSAPAGSAAVVFNSGETAEAMLCGFTLTNSDTGIAVGNSSPTIVSNVIAKCNSGIGCSFASPIIRGNRIVGCTGNALSLGGAANPLVEANILSNNGYGISMFAAGSPVIRNNLIRGNRGDGLGMINDSNADIIQNLILDNGGNGVVAQIPFYNRGPLMVNNTVAGNGAAGVALDGFHGSAQLINNIVLGNPALTASGYGRSSLPLLQCNIFYPANGVIYAGAVTNLAGIAGNLSAKPFFACLPSQDFHLLAGSPGIDAGTNNVGLLPATDWDGNPRVRPGVTNGPAGVDLGAFEFDAAAPPTPCLYINCPADLVVTNLPGQTSVALTYPAPDAPPFATVSCSPVSGSVFSSGTNLVTCTASLGTNTTSCSFTITVLVPPAIVFQPQSTSVLAGDLATLSVGAQGTAPLGYQWTFEGNALPGATNSSLTLTNAQAQDEGLYRAVVTNPAGAITSAAALLRVVPTGPAIVAAPGSQAVSAGSEVTLGVSVRGSAPLTFQWLRNGTILPGAVAPQLVISDIQAGEAGNYQVTVSNSLGSVSSPAAMLYVLPAVPAFVQQPTGASLVSGSDLTLTAQARGTEPLTYQWRRDGIALPGASQPALTLTNLGVADAGVYEVAVSNALGVAISQAAPITVTTAPPVFVQQPPSSKARSGDFLRLSSRAVGSLPLSYRWYLQGTNLPAQTQSELTLPAVSLADAGNYFVVASNAFGVATSAVAQITVSGPPLILQPLTNQVVDAGSTVVLAVAAMGNGPLHYSWRLNGSLLASATNSSLVLSNAQPSQSGFYQVTVSSPDTDCGGYYYLSTVSAARLTVFNPASAVVAWGDNSGGQTNVPAALQDAVMVAGGDFHSLALRRDGSLLAWGNNGQGQTSLPTNNTGFVSIAVGADHNLALTEDGRITAWGANEAGQASVPSGLGSALSIAAGGAHSLALLTNGLVVGWGDNTYGQSSPPWAIGWCYAVRAVAAGRNHSLALLSDGTVAGWGLNSSGQATAPPGLSGVTAIAAGDAHSVALRADGTVVAWGDDSLGQTEVPAGLSNVVAIAAGDLHTLALRADGTVVAWGDNSLGQLELPAGMAGAVGLACGNYHGLALIRAARVVPVVIQTQPADTVVSEHSDTYLSVVPAGSGQFRFQWYCNGQVLAAATNSSCPLSSLGWADSGAEYFCLVSRADPGLTGSARSRTATVTVQPQLPAVVFSLGAADKQKFVLGFSTVAGGRYQVEYTESLAQPTWLPLSPVQTASGSAMFIGDPANYLTNQHRFYRITRLP